MSACGMARVLAGESFFFGPSYLSSTDTDHTFPQKTAYIQFKLCVLCGSLCQYIFYAHTLEYILVGRKNDWLIQCRQVI